jgi:hypothetical protein
MREVRLPGRVVDEPHIELPLRQIHRMAAQSDIQTVRVILQMLLPATAVVTVLDGPAPPPPAMLAGGPAVRPSCRS